MRIVHLGREAGANRFKVSLLQVGTIIYFGYSQRDGRAKRICADAASAV